jgi:hypothetical protein
MRILFLTNFELARWRVGMIRLIAFALAAATTPALAQNYQPYNPNAPQHYNNAPGLYAPGLTGGPRTYPGPGGYPYWSGYVDAPVGQPIPPATGLPSASGTVMRGAFATRASAADRASVSVISLTARLQRKTPGPKAEIEKKRDRR